MTTVELLELIRKGENSGVEFKRDEIQNYELAKEIVAFLNFYGGSVILGVEDDGAIRGTTRGKLDEWVAELCRVKIDPPIIPYLESFPEIEPGKSITVVTVPTGLDKPYARLHDNKRTYFIRVGSTSREASREELERMFQASGRINYGMKPVAGAALGDLDLRRLKDYFERVLGTASPDTQIQEWEALLRNLEFMTLHDERAVPTVDGMLLFGTNVARFLPQSGVRALAFNGTTMEYAATADEQLKGPLAPLYTPSGEITESGLVEQCLYFVRRNMAITASLQDGVRVERPDYPEDVIREIVVNALVHRDYSIAGTDITLAIYSDRLELTSPGRLSNTASVDALKAGFRYARNQTLVNVMRDYRYVEARGMGIRNKVIPGMQKHNATAPDFIETERDFTVRLRK